MKLRWKQWLLLSLLPVLATAQVREKEEAVDLDLDALRWEKRVLVLFSPSESDPSFQSQKQDLVSRPLELLDRDLIILEILEDGVSRAADRVLSKNAVKGIRSRFGVPSGVFQVLLVGKDGTVKLRSTEPVPARDIFRLIDSMPMRRQEMERKGKSSS